MLSVDRSFCHGDEGSKASGHGSHSGRNMLLSFGRDRNSMVGEPRGGWFEAVEAVHMRRDANGAANVSSPAEHGRSEAKCAAFTASRTARCEQRIEGVGCETEQGVLSLAPHDALREVRLRDEDTSK